jgi:hypothetical protein
VARGSKALIRQAEEGDTMAWQLLVSSDSGLFSLFTVLMVIAIGGGFWWFLRRRIAEDEHNNPGKG